MGDNQICFNLHSLSYSANDWIKGEVNLKIENPLAISSLILKFAGTESVARPDVVPETIQSEIISLEVTVYEPPNSNLDIGDYVFPFEIHLPKDLPSSTSIIASSFQVQVSYIISAHLTPTLASSSYIIIQSHQDFPPILNKTDCQIDLKSCCCFTRASIDFSVSAKKFSYNSNEIMKMSIKGLCRVMPSAQIRFIRKVMTNMYGKIKVEIDEIFNVSTDEENIDFDLKAFEERLKIQTTSRGKFFACSYYAEVTGMPQVLCGSEGPELQLCVVINPLRRSAPIPNYSGAWRPKKMPGVIFEGKNTNLENN